MKELTKILLFFLFYLSLQQYIVEEQNLFFQFVNETSTSDAFVSLTTKRKSSFTILAISSTNQTFEDSIAYMYYSTLTERFLNRYKGDKNISFPIQKELYNSTDEIIRKTTFKEVFYMDYKEVYIYLNQTSFLSKFNSKFWVYIGFNTNSQPNNNTDFERKIDNYMIFEYDIQKSSPYSNNLFTPWNRIEIFHPSIFIITLVYFLFIFILLICFSQKQPLLSRNFLPLLACLSHFFHLFSDFTIYFLELRYLQYYCVIRFFIQYPLMNIIVFLYLLHFFRYVSLISISQQQSLLIKNNFDKSGKATGFFLVLKFMGKWYTHIIVIIFFTIFINILYLVMFIIFEFKCNNYQEYLYTAIMVMIAILAILIFIYDIVLNREKIIKCNLISFWKDDILYFRIEIFIFGFLISFVYFIIYSIVSFIIDIDFIAIGVLDGISFHLLFFTQVLFPLIITIINTIRGYFVEKNEISDVKRYLLQEDLQRLFMNYSQSEFSVENLLCFLDIYKFKNEKNLEQKCILAKGIFNKYLKGNGSEFEINISQRTINETFQQFEDGKVDDELFFHIEGNLFSNIGDTWSRFSLTREFKHYKANKTFVQKSLNISQIM